MPNQPLLGPYWENRTHFSIVDDLLLCDERLVIPKSMRYSNAFMLVILAYPSAELEHKHWYGGQAPYAD